MYVVFLQSESMPQGFLKPQKHAEDAQTERSIF